MHDLTVFIVCRQEHSWRKDYEIARLFLFASAAASSRRHSCETIRLLYNQTKPVEIFKMVKNTVLGLYREGNGKRMICKKSACPLLFGLKNIVTNIQIMIKCRPTVCYTKLRKLHRLNVNQFLKDKFLSRFKNVHQLFNDCFC